MSINKIFVPEKKVLKEFLQQYGSKVFYSRYVKKTEALIGSSKSINYIEQFKNKYKNEGDPVFFKLG